MNMLTKQQFLEPLARHRTDEIVVTTMSTVRAWGELSRHELDFASADSAMGHAADLALGLALAQPQRRVLCLNGDGSMLMSLGTLVTIADCRASNLILFIVQNDSYEVTGNQPIPGAGLVDFAAMGLACGFLNAFTFNDATAYEEQLDAILQLSGPTLVVVHVERGEAGPLKRGDEGEVEYLRPSLAQAAHGLRKLLSNEG
jgi:thiamine pyrophosphate-dependent acetolactate synthase large subunit-like protein